MAKQFVFLLHLAMFLTVCSASFSAEPNEPFLVWNEINVEKSSPKDEWSTSIVGYYPEGIVYADRIDRTDSGGDGPGPGTVYSIGDSSGSLSSGSEPLDLDVIIRVVPEISPPSQDSNSIFATLFSVHGEIPYEQLDRFRIICLEVFHGKLYAGLSGGPDNAYRRWLYVTESVEYGEGLSRKFRAESLQGAELLIDGIQPAGPRLSKESLLKPTAIKLQLRSSAAEAGLEGADFVGPDGTSNTYFQLPADSNECSYDVNFPEADRWLQYKVIMTTSDTRVTPVLQKVELRACEQTIVSDSNWSAGQLIDCNNLFTQHSPGEIVLANRRLSSGQTSVIQVIQPPCVNPQWCYNQNEGGLIQGGRGFKTGNWPYAAIGDMEPLKGNLYMRVGPAIGCGTGCCAGDLIGYNFANGVFRAESPYYNGGDPNNPSEITLWGEGGGWIKKMGDLLIDPQMDSKIGLWDGTRYVAGEAEEWYMYTEGDGQWKLGLIPARVNGRMPLHIWDINLFSGYYFFATNQGVICRSVPTPGQDHTETEAWKYFGYGLPPDAPAQSMAPAYFAVYDRHFIIASIVTISSPWQVTRKLYVLNYDLEPVWEEEFTSENSKIKLGHFEYEGRLVSWKSGSEATLYFTDPKLRAIPPKSSLIWQRNSAVTFELPVEGGKGDLHWQIIDGNLPSSVNLDQTQGVISGTPDEVGAFDVVFKVTDSDTPRAQSIVSYSITVSDVISKPGDLNGDGSVNFDDFSVLALAWLSSPSNNNWDPECDISIPKDDIINYNDLGVLMDYWLN